MKNRSIDQREGRTGEEVADVFELAHPRDRRRPAGPRNRRSAAPRDSKQPRAELDIHPVGGVREDIGAKPAEHRLEDRDHDQTRARAYRASKTPVNQHLVDHDLEEKRRDQREELQE